jgi:hypothetical protein
MRNVDLKKQGECEHSPCFFNGLSGEAPSRARTEAVSLKRRSPLTGTAQNLTVAADLDRPVDLVNQPTGGTSHIENSTHASQPGSE